MSAPALAPSHANPLHASSVAIGGRVVLIAGRPGSGKSDLALRLVDRGALLVADDYTRLDHREGRLVATPPPRIAGKIEVRGVGILDLPFAAEGMVSLLVDLDGPVERLPDEPLPTTALEGVAIPTLALAAFEASAPIKVEQALHRHGLGGPQ
ncbi:MULTISPECIES: HPr kinase/phosphorylase [unclassified Sphingomonas]|uniref:HPr kinase/phosphorylase n=1 Tax=unclassified Sphingomonas TaxID=196159 RepID=UPI0006FC8924|nr:MULTISPECIES: HPr kinase/phosphatase C-terminal domain-containing protein [unclassified Sphingomonas]KQX20033.1 aldolase [Sphingomonas sp. Root1294]KQY67283.1 aldolase [Sphingomonas sp. Root50]KRB90658.1 aldolase [Sphingomonas sp. Root720]